MASHIPTSSRIAEIVGRIAAAQQRLLDAIALLTDEQLQAPVLANHWSVKDVLAHLEFWDQRLLHAIEPEGRAHANWLAPPLIADIPYDEQWLETVNVRIYARNRQRDLRDVQVGLTATQRRLLTRVASLTQQELFDPDGPSSSLGETLPAMVLGAYEHYEEHAETLDAQEW
jgi:hypothetical protein